MHLRACTNVTIPAVYFEGPRKEMRGIVRSAGPNRLLYAGGTNNAWRHCFTHLISAYANAIYLRTMYVHAYTHNIWQISESCRCAIKGQNEHRKQNHLWHAAVNENPPPKKNVCNIYIHIISGFVSAFSNKLRCHPHLPLLPENPAPSCAQRDPPKGTQKDAVALLALLGWRGGKPLTRLPSGLARKGANWLFATKYVPKSLKSELKTVGL